MPRLNKSGVNWSDPEQARAAKRENMRDYRARGGKQNRAVVIGGVTYKSQAAAARALGVSHQRIWQILHPEWRKADDEKRRSKRVPHPRQRRWIKLSDADAAAVVRLLRHFPQCTSFDALVSYAIQHLASHTDD